MLRCVPEARVVEEVVAAAQDDLERTAPIELSHRICPTGEAVVALGGELDILMSSAKDTRYLGVYGYARLVGYDSNYKLIPDILESFEVEEGRIFTFHLRKGHKWSDGAAFTTEDFRYYWEDIANNPDLSPLGPPRELLVEGEAPRSRSSTRRRSATAGPNPTPNSCRRWLAPIASSSSAPASI